MAYKDPLDPRARAARLKHYYANKEQYLDRAKTQRAEMTALVNAAKDVPCTDCGIKYPPYVMQFDHVRGDKKFNLAEAKAIGSKRRVLAEIAKCEVVCANCHTERTHSRAKG
jgi:hypothetical protein